MGASVKAATKGLKGIHKTLEEAQLKDRRHVNGGGGEPIARVTFSLSFTFFNKHGWKMEEKLEGDKGFQRDRC